MRIHNLYTDASGQSHFRDIEVEWVEERRGSKLSKRLPANGIIFRETQAEHDIDWHPAPRRQYIINLDAGVKITASDGESRVIGVGEVILVEDITGKGHLSQHVEGKIRHSCLCAGRITGWDLVAEGGVCDTPFSSCPRKRGSRAQVAEFGSGLPLAGEWRNRRETSPQHT